MIWVPRGTLLTKDRDNFTRRFAIIALCPALLISAAWFHMRQEFSYLRFREIFRRSAGSLHPGIVVADCRLPCTLARRISGLPCAHLFDELVHDLSVPYRAPGSFRGCPRGCRPF